MLLPPAIMRSSRGVNQLPCSESFRSYRSTSIYTVQEWRHSMTEGSCVLRSRPYVLHVQARERLGSPHLMYNPVMRVRRPDAMLPYTTPYAGEVYFSACPNRAEHYVDGFVSSASFSSSPLSSFLGFFNASFHRSPTCWRSTSGKTMLKTSEYHDTGLPSMPSLIFYNLCQHACQIIRNMGEE